MQGIRPLCVETRTGTASQSTASASASVRSNQSNTSDCTELQRNTTQTTRHCLSACPHNVATFESKFTSQPVCFPLLTPPNTRPARLFQHCLPPSLIVILPISSSVSHLFEAVARAEANTVRQNVLKYRSQLACPGSRGVWIRPYQPNRHQQPVFQHHDTTTSQARYHRR